MIKRNFKTTIFGLTFLILTNYTIKAQETTSAVKIIGQMKNVMWKGQLYGNINLDTISNKENLYGLGRQKQMHMENGSGGSESFCLNGFFRQKVLMTVTVANRTDTVLNGSDQSNWGLFQSKSRGFGTPVIVYDIK